MNTIIVSHGIKFIRKGECNQCGRCECEECPHHFRKRGKSYCSIYDARDEVCQICSEKFGDLTTHQSCIGYPDNPWIRLVRRGNCAYKFERADGGSMDDLPFLHGKPYLMTDGNHDR